MKNSFIIILIIINKDALLSKGASNEETASQDQQLHPCDTDSENTSLLVNNSNISLLFPPDTFMVIMFNLSCVFEHRTLQLRDSKHRRDALSRGTVSCCFHQHRNFFSSLIDGCLKYKSKEKPKTGPRPGSRLNYDVKIGPKPGPRDVKKSGPVGAGAEMQGSSSSVTLVWSVSRDSPDTQLFVERV